jgi:formate dehydrogenase iron-sulfur subunit
MMSDVCKHCTHAGCLEACPTGAIVRNEFDDVYIQPDICNGCGYCVPSCPFGVVDLIATPTTPSRAISSPTAAPTTTRRRRTAASPANARSATTVRRSARAGVREGVPDRIDSVRRRRRTARAREGARRATAARGVDSYLYGVDSDVGRRPQRVLSCSPTCPKRTTCPSRPGAAVDASAGRYASAAIVAAALALVGFAIFRGAR